jgi:DNA-binding transcriptional ArsR family regulator
MPAREIRHPPASELDLATILRTVGDPVRLAIVQLLSDDRERRCTQVGDIVEIPASTLSYHLRLLREAGVTRTRVAGTERHVSLRRDDLERIYPGLLGVIAAKPRKRVRAA